MSSIQPSGGKLWRMKASKLRNGELVQAVDEPFLDQPGARAATLTGPGRPSFAASSPESYGPEPRCAIAAR